MSTKSDSVIGTTDKNDAADGRIGDFFCVSVATATGAAATVLNVFEQCRLVEHSTQRDVNRGELPTGKGADDRCLWSAARAEGVAAIKLPSDVPPSLNLTLSLSPALIE